MMKLAPKTRLMWVYYHPRGHWAVECTSRPIALRLALGAQLRALEVRDLDAWEGRVEVAVGRKCVSVDAHSLPVEDPPGLVEVVSIWAQCREGRWQWDEVDRTPSPPPRPGTCSGCGGRLISDGGAPIRWYQCHGCGETWREGVA